MGRVATMSGVPPDEKQDGHAVIWGSMGLASQLSSIKDRQFKQSYMPHIVHTGPKYAPTLLIPFVIQQMIPKLVTSLHQTVMAIAQDSACSIQ